MAESCKQPIELTSILGHPTPNLQQVSECVLSRSSCDSTMKAAILFNFTNAGRISATWAWTRSQKYVHLPVLLRLDLSVFPCPFVFSLSLSLLFLSWTLCITVQRTLGAEDV